MAYDEKRRSPGERYSEDIPLTDLGGLAAADVSTATEELQGLLAGMKLIGAGMKAALARGDIASATIYKSQFLAMVARANALRGQLNDAEQPSGFMTTLGQFSDAALSVVTDAGAISKQFASGMAEQVPKVAGQLPTVLIVGFVAAGVLGAAYLASQRRRR